MTISNYLENKLLDTLGNNSFSVVQPYAKLHLGDPGEDATANPAAAPAMTTTGIQNLARLMSCDSNHASRTDHAKRTSRESTLALPSLARGRSRDLAYISGLNISVQLSCAKPQVHCREISPHATHPRSGYGYPQCVSGSSHADRTCRSPRRGPEHRQPLEHR